MAWDPINELRRLQEELLAEVDQSRLELLAAIKRGQEERRRREEERQQRWEDLAGTRTIVFVVNLFFALLVGLFGVVALLMFSAGENGWWEPALFMALSFMGILANLKFLEILHR